MGIGAVKDEKQKGDEGKDEPTRLYAEWTAGEPARPVERSGEKPCVDRRPAAIAAVRRSENVERGVVEERVESDCEPDASSPQHGERHEESEESDAQSVSEILCRSLQEVVLRGKDQ